MPVCTHGRGVSEFLHCGQGASVPDHASSVADQGQFLDVRVSLIQAQY